MLADSRRINSMLAAIGLDAIVATAPPNVSYLTGFYSWADAALKTYMVDPGASSEPANLRFAVFVPGCPTGLVVDPLSAANTDGREDLELWPAGEHPFASDLAGIADDPAVSRIVRALMTHRANHSPINGLVALLRDRGVAQGRVGLDTEWLSPQAQQSIRDALPNAEIRGCSNTFRLLRAAKSAAELDLLARAALINERAATAAVNAARVDAPISLLKRVFHHELVESDAVPEHVLYGVRGLGAASETDYRLRPDDILLLDVGCFLDRYVADTGMTVAVAEPPADVIRAYEGLSACIGAGRSSIRPGALASDVHQAMREAADVVDLIAVAPEGHGIGLEMRDYPIIGPPNGRALADDCIDISADLMLEPGMVINLEAAQFRPGQASLQFEQSFVVTEDGVRDLIAQTRDSIRSVS